MCPLLLSVPTSVKVVSLGLATSHPQLFPRLNWEHPTDLVDFPNLPFPPKSQSAQYPP